MALIDDIKKHEGFSSVVYKCTAGYDTIGYGKRVKYLQVTKEQSKEWLKEDVENLKYILANKYEWYTSAPDKVKSNDCLDISVSSVKLDIPIIKLDAEQVTEEPDTEEVKSNEQSVRLTGVPKLIVIR